ncbi:MAG: S-layer homology domain-containing protein [Verrucomicrobia bacterium]|nr:S-layer homology domain-containing protein [Leptolyngbya sp. ES-bin-22]
MTPTPDPQPDRKRLGADELIAVFVALTSIGAIFFWSISQNRGLDAPFLQSPFAANTLTTAPSPPVSPSVQASVSVIAPNRSIAQAPLTSVAPGSPTLTPPALQAAPFVAAAPQILPSPQTNSTPAAQPKQFADVPAGYWASAPIAALSAQGILNGFPDGSFQPNKPITRVEFAAIIQRAFNQPSSREALKFSDLQADTPAIAAINEATQTRFMSGFPDGSFQPNRQIPRLQVLIALVTGLNLQAKLSPNQVLSRYQDAEQIPKYALDKIAAATEAGLVLNDTNPNVLAPNQVTTRAEAAALVYEALRK